MKLSDKTPKYILSAHALGVGLSAKAGPVSRDDIEELLTNAYATLLRWGVPTSHCSIQLDLIQRGKAGPVRSASVMVTGHELAHSRSHEALAGGAADTFRRFGMGAALLQETKA